MEQKRKLRLIVLDGEVTVDDLVKLKQGGFFEGLMVFEVPEGLRGQMVTMGVPSTPVGAQVRAAHAPAPVAVPAAAPANAAREGLPPGPPEYLTPLEATAFGWFLNQPRDVMAAYADGAAAVTRSAYTEEQIANVFKAYKAVQDGKRTEEQGRAWWKASQHGTVKPGGSSGGSVAPPAAKAPDAVLPAEPRSYEDAQFVELLNTRKYLRQIVSDLFDIGVKARPDVLAACEKLKDRVPRIAAEGVNLRSRIDASFSAIGA